MCGLWFIGVLPSNVWFWINNEPPKPMLEPGESLISGEACVELVRGASAGYDQRRERHPPHNLANCRRGCSIAHRISPSPTLGRRPPRAPGPAPHTPRSGVFRLVGLPVRACKRLRLRGSPGGGRGNRPADLRAAV
jgi:hypothetical protein